jgi:release factor glutamine methyltransferase
VSTGTATLRPGRGHAAGVDRRTALAWAAGVLEAAEATRRAAEAARPPISAAERARFEAAYLLAGCLGEGLAEVRAWPERPVPPDAWAEFQRRVERRRRGEPLQYVEGRAAFRSLWLRVDPRVLIPRPETEELVEQVLAWARATGRQGLAALDLGTGSGAIALSLAAEGPFARVVAVDISSDALHVARENAREAGLGARVEFRLGSLFEPVRPGERFDVIVSNPPYLGLAERAQLVPEVRDWEPPVALFAGPTGTEVLDRIAAEAGRVLAPGGLLALEVAPAWAARMRRRLARDPGCRRVRVARDLAGCDRIVLAEFVGREE